MKAKPDPLGVQPTPVHGDPKPDHADAARNARAEAVLPFFKANYIEHQPQTDVVEQLLGYMRSARRLTGSPMDGRRLSEHSGAGKSRMIEHLLRTAAMRRAEAGLPPNPHQIVRLELDKTTSVATFFRQALRLMGDEHWNDKRATIDELEERLSEFVRRLEVEALVGDEVQHLDRKTTNAAQVTDRFKTFLNRGVVPLILVGDEDADVFFGKNPKFAARLGTPLHLKPLDVRSSKPDQKLFLDFCQALDASMVAAKIVDQPGGLALKGVRSQLAAISGGHVGRVCRLVCEATQHALRRGSPLVERHDLSVATRTYAIGLKWVFNDPFSSRARP